MAHDKLEVPDIHEAKLALGDAIEKLEVVNSKSDSDHVVNPNVKEFIASAVKNAKAAMADLDSALQPHPDSVHTAAKPHTHTAKDIK